MTTATNALLQRSGARIAFITNEGFRDLLLVGRQNRPSLYDIRKTRPEPLVRREDCHTVRGRLDPAGNEIAPLDEDGLRRIGERLHADGVSAVAICFLHAYANPAHERRARAILTEALPGVPVCHLDRHSRRVPRVRAGQHGRAERLRAAGHRAISREPGRIACRPRRGARAGGRRAGHGHGGGRRADDRRQRPRKAGAHGAVGAGRRGRRRARMSRRCRVSPTSSRSTWAAPAPTSAWCSTAARR